MWDYCSIDERRAYSTGYASMISIFIVLEIRNWVGLSR